jgi:hypothetical protein
MVPCSLHNSNGYIICKQNWYIAKKKVSKVGLRFNWEEYMGLRSGGPSYRPSLWARAPSVLAPRTPPPAAARLRTGHVSRGVRRVAVPADVPSPSAALDQPAGEGLGYLAQWSRKIITSCTLLVQDRWAGVARSPGAATRTLMDDA